MATTDSNGIVFYEEGDLFAPVHTALNLLSASVSAALDEVTEQTEDTDWIDLVPYLGSNYGATTVFRGRRIGNDVEISGQINRTTLSFGSDTSYNVASNIPANLRPAYLAPGTGQFSGNTPGVAYMSPGGTLTVGHQAGSNRSWVYVHIRYYVG